MMTYEPRPAEQFHFNEFVIPDYMREPITEYADHHRPVGSFLQAVLENDLMAAMGRADEDNLRNLPAYGNFLYNHVPSTCWGSPEKVAQWLKNEDE